MDNNSRATRFLIDRIDSKLGSVEKELKFDKIAIGVGLGIMVIFAFVLGLVVNSSPALAILCLILIMFGFFLAYVMVKEYIDDRKKL
jgi:lipopolysaccharide export LptBFGC system permease protein LptF